MTSLSSSRFDVRNVNFQNGSYRVTWQPAVEGNHTLIVTLKEQHVKDSPMTVTVHQRRDYSTIGSPVFTFGREGTGDGYLCRPWGICCSKDGLILVMITADVMTGCDSMTIFTLLTMTLLLMTILNMGDITRYL